MKKKIAQIDRIKNDPDKDNEILKLKEAIEKKDWAEVDNILEKKKNLVNNKIKIR